MNITATLIVQLVAFACFVVFTRKLVWPFIEKAMEERKRTIAAGLAAAEAGEKAHQQAELEAQKLIAAAKDQAGEIVAKAEQRGSEIVSAAKDSAVTEAVRIKDAASADIAAERVKAAQQLRQQVASIAIEGAQKILEREINADNHKDLLDQCAAKL